MTKEIKIFSILIARDKDNKVPRREELVQLANNLTRLHDQVTDFLNFKDTGDDATEKV